MSEKECCIDYRHVICIADCVQSPLPSGKRRGPFSDFSWGEWALYTGHLLCGNETQGLLLCSLPFAACYSPGTNRHAVLRAGGALERDIKQRKLLFLNDVSRLSVVLFQCAPSFQHGVFFATWITTARDKSSWRTCLKRVLLSTISFIYYFILFKRRKSPHPRINVVCGKRKTWGSKKQHWLLGEGRG